jgi:flagellar basal-body rod modification protein FlgD
MAAMAGILNHNHSLTTGQALTGAGASPMASSTSGTSGSSGASSSSATISANDFLTLLVTEMQNQDPTADTDPNEYINQLVNVNSLEQLIDINQTLTADSTASTAASGGGSATGQAVSATSPTGGGNAAAATPHLHGVAHRASAQSSALSAAAAGAPTTQSAAGNLGIPAANPAANRVGHALDGRHRTPSIPSGLPSAQ